MSSKGCKVYTSSHKFTNVLHRLKSVFANAYKRLHKLTKVCTSLHKFTNLCKSSQTVYKRFHVCKSLQKFAQVYTSLHVFAKVYTSSQQFTCCLQKVTNKCECLHKFIGFAIKETCNILQMVTKTLTHFAKKIQFGPNQYKVYNSLQTNLQTSTQVYKR